MRCPVPYGPPVHPVFTSQQSVSCQVSRSASISAYRVGGSGMNGAPKQVENTGRGSSTPTSVPATLLV